jgi:hypothetical protein
MHGPNEWNELLSQDLDHTQHAETRRAVEEAARLSWPYLLMNAAAMLIAGFGLLGDSTQS